MVKTEKSHFFMSKGARGNAGKYLHWKVDLWGHWLVPAQIHEKREEINADERYTLIC
jgi:hypothetical protein